MTKSEQAVQIWQVLVSAAYYRQTLTYTLLAERIGMDAGALGVPLGVVNRYCSMKQLPPLAVLVVRSDAGTPATDLAWTPFASPPSDAPSVEQVAARILPLRCRQCPPWPLSSIPARASCANRSARRAAASSPRAWVNVV